MFTNTSIDFEILKAQAHNLRWATVEDGIIPLTAADPDFPVAPEIREAICQFSQKGYFSYGPALGMASFRKQVALFFQTERKINITADGVMATDSAAHGLYMACKALLEPGNEAIIFDPVDFLFKYSVEAAGAVAVPFAVSAGSELDLEKLEQLVTRNTRLLCICNPLNPNGKVFTQAELLQLGNFALRHKLVILSDEIWSDIVYKPSVFCSIASLSPELNQNTITVTGFSKSYGLAGLRIGALATANSLFFNKIVTASLHESTVHGVSVLSQVAATAAMQHARYWVTNFVEHLTKMRQLAVDRLNMLPGFQCMLPEGCYVVFPDIKGTGMSSQQITDLLYQKARVSVVPGLPKWFGQGADGHIRLSFATSEEILTQALNRIEHTILELA